MLDEALDVHFELLQLTRGYPAVIARGTQSCPAIVVMGRSNASALTKEDIRFEAGAQEILVAFDEYKPTGVQSDPQPDDTIMVTFPNRSTSLFEVRPASDTEQCANLNAQKTQYRVHTKQRN